MVRCSRNTAAHRTSAGEVSGTQDAGQNGRFGKLKIDASKAKMSYDDLLPPGSKLRKMAFRYYKKDFEMFSAINVPPFDNSRYKEDLEELRSLGL